MDFTGKSPSFVFRIWVITTLVPMSWSFSGCDGCSDDGEDGAGDFGIVDETPFDVGTDDAENIAVEQIWESIAAAGRHTCATKDDGSLWCWGHGYHGQLGLGDSDDRLEPEQVGDDFGWTTVSADAVCTCAIRDDGSLWCWGAGNNGRLGLGEDTSDRPEPERVSVDDE